MSLIAWWNNHARRSGYVEARLVVQQNDVRKFSGGIARRGRRLQPISDGGVRFQKTVRCELVNRIDAGARKLRYIVSIEKFAVKIGGIGRRQNDQRTHAQGAAKRTRAYTNAEGINAP